MQHTAEAKDVYKTRFWCYKIIRNPYHVLATVFGYAEISEYRTAIQELLLATGPKKIYNSTEPATVINRFAAITSVILAARQFNTIKKQRLLQPDVNNYMDMRLYAPPNATGAEWEYMPRQLSLAEYNKPYQVFNQFFKYKPVEKWLMEVHFLKDYAFARYTNKYPHNLLKIYIHLVKLLEAAHLINIRAVTPVNKP